MARSSSGIVAGLTVAAIAAVSFLAYQASASVPDTLGKPHASASPKASVSKAPRDKKNPAALPTQSGTGERVVYSTDDDRVWLVGADNKVQHTFKVTPGTIDPAVGTYAVTTRSNAVTGSDGAQIEHVVRFTLVDGIAIGFSAAVNGSTASPDSTKKLGGIRESRKNGTAMWEFATIGVKVEVIQ
ncbi:MULTISPECIES: hypothetical protein [unclassified Streptomyces]|uniref:hypothetical protein n=1 Tax=unclassified Streptomyces TaxID=2593676 RepID=UPI002E7FB744|nr:hypothetical protein [Streptomyces sp. NBC_00589]WTI36881.1 hypothetical protein OIC96_18635 [Streptomyces sp. NBC_00775]WUB29443.1 hypothetical protein OHA51_31100 [Streptomyces sp. NBC_00589]